MTMKLAVIGGSGLFSFDSLRQVQQHRPKTPYGEPTAPVLEGELNGRALLFLSRHGRARHVPPHAINYRANIRALRDLGASHIVTINIVGGITPSMVPGAWVVADQIIDYSWGREHSFYDAGSTRTEHIDFTEPYDAGLRRKLLAVATTQGMQPIDGATYACTQGPRLETAAEIRRLQRDGCDIVGMTAMPEAGLARELGLPYAGLSLVVNWAAGLTDEAISVDDMTTVVDANMPLALAAIAAMLA